MMYLVRSLDYIDLPVNVLRFRETFSEELMKFGFIVQESCIQISKLLKNYAKCRRFYTLNRTYIMLQLLFT